MQGNNTDQVVADYTDFESYKTSKDLKIPKYQNTWKIPIGGPMYNLSKGCLLSYE